MIKKYLFFAIFIFAFLGFAPQVLAFTFTKDLSLGMTNQDVYELQRVLNSDLTTRVASIGVGSPGQESTYFGSLTKAAVIKFQNKYASEILTPAGLTTATGYVGFVTRAKLNSLLRGETTLDISTIPKSGSTSGAPTTSTVTEYPFTGSFTRLLSIGSVGGDVKALQQFLNSDPTTRIGTTGSGSLGQETTYFGALTAEALARFQTKHASELIYPQGLTKASGVLDARTRSFINDIISGKITLDPNNPQSTTPPTTTTGTGQTTSTNTIASSASMQITSVSPTSVKAGDTMTVKGSGFKASTSLGAVVESDYAYYFVWDLSVTDSSNLTFKIPSELSLGTYKVFLINELTQTNPIIVTITSSSSSGSTSSGTLSPSSGVYGSIVTISGGNFSSRGNIVYTNYGTTYSVDSADGKTISFKAEVPNRSKEAFFAANNNVAYFSAQYTVMINNGTTSQYAFTILNQ